MQQTTSIQQLLAALDVPLGGASKAGLTLPFAEGDLTAGSESELQAVVCGPRDAVDLPLAIEQSSYYGNLLRRIATGDAPKRASAALATYLHENQSEVWENSWVRFPRARLNLFTQTVLQRDLRADKRDGQGSLRKDWQRFFLVQAGEDFVRLPVSYVLKLALAEAISCQPALPAPLFRTGAQALAHFLNDNSSPETFSFFVTQPTRSNGLGREVAREKSKRFLLTQLLALFANRRFGLAEQNQRVLVYFAPHPPVRQQQLNECIPDAFYRDLFMSPCLSGWDEGAAKHEYMHLCHQVLSRSQLNAVAKLREAGILLNDLVVLPNLSNVSLANNGTHVSLGSRKLTEARRAGVLSAAAEKQLGDLTIKFTEHFLPLFVGTYSAAPYRFAFADFHPERVLGFLPHELDYTHLRMLWRRWRGKAALKIFGYPLTPYGPRWLDEPLGRLFRLRGDWVVDARLVDYPVALLSTASSPALDGTLGNAERLKRELAELGVFDERMSLYLLYRLREFNVMGFSGFEGRHYSQFASLRADMSRAVDLQILVTALAFKLQIEGRLTHADLPDQPFVESERRQIFFAAALGLPTFFVKRDTPNRVLQDLLKRTTKTRVSRRYAGYVRVQLEDFRQALWQTLQDEAAPLIEQFGLAETLADLQQRLQAPQESAASGQLVRGILNQETGARRTPLHMPAREFNQQAEAFYRTTLRERQLREAYDWLREDWRALEQIEVHFREDLRGCLRQVLGQRQGSELLERLQPALLKATASEDELLLLINLVLLSLWWDTRQAAATPPEPARQEQGNHAEPAATSVH
jgi:hypothetical protein